MLLKVAIIGGGIAGITAAFRLQNGHDISLYEAESRLGGHAHSVSIPQESGEQIAVDSAFMIFNDGAYPRFIQLLKEWGVDDLIQQSPMSVGVWAPQDHFCYSTKCSFGSFFSQIQNIADPRIWRVACSILKFRDRLYATQPNLSPIGLTLKEYFKDAGYSEDFFRYFLAPIGAAVWSMPYGEMLNYPAQTYFNFLRNHQYLRRGSSHRWHTLKGSSCNYIAAFQRQFRGQLYLNSPIKRVEKSNHRIEIVSADGSKSSFDRVVIATHADQALRLLAVPSVLEQKLLAPWSYISTPVTIHTDHSLLPKDRNLWASWNITINERQSRAHARITYYLNAVQNLSCKSDYFVSLNDTEVDPSLIIHKHLHRHPVYNFASIATQKDLHLLQGVSGIYFCGSYFGFGFHEDAIRSSENVANQLR